MEETQTSMKKTLEKIIRHTVVVGLVIGPILTWSNYIGYSAARYRLTRYNSIELAKKYDGFYLMGVAGKNQIKEPMDSILRGLYKVEFGIGEAIAYTQFESKRKD
jgi:hypothetical protein